MAQRSDNDQQLDQPTQRPIQPQLFEITSAGTFTPEISGVGPLTPTCSLEVARFWYRRHLEQDERPETTVKSYMYDLAILEQVIGPKTIDAVTRRDIAKYLGDAKTRSTRKRRLTSASGLFKWLVERAKMLDKDPTESFYPDHIPLKTPRPLFSNEQTDLIAAAVEDSPRSALMCWIMLNLGLTRGEVLDLKASDIDFSDPARIEVHVFHERTRHRNSERKLEAGEEFRQLYDAFVKEFGTDDKLFDMLPQSVNKMAERVGKAAGIAKRVTPQMLRDTFAFNAASVGADEERLLSLLGLAPDLRNRASVRRYIRLAAPAVNADTDTTQHIERSRDKRSFSPG